MKLFLRRLFIAMLLATAGILGTVVVPIGIAWLFRVLGTWSVPFIMWLILVFVIYIMGLQDEC